MAKNSTGDGRRHEFRKLWNREVRAKIAAGMTPSSAKSAVANERPELRQELVAAFNAPATTPATSELDRLRGEVQDDIRALMEANGWDRQHATREAFQRKPELRKQLVAAANAS